MKQYQLFSVQKTEFPYRSSMEMECWRFVLHQANDELLGWKWVILFALLYWYGFTIDFIYQIVKQFDFMWFFIWDQENNKI